MPSPIKNSDQGGRREGQKYKSLLVWQYLLRNSDENHAVKSEDIRKFLNRHGISADRHSVVRDIQAIQDLFERSMNVDSIGEIDEDDVDDYDAAEEFRYEVIYDAAAHGYKIISRPYEFDDLRLLAECINATRFLTGSQASRLKLLIGEFCSKYQEEELDNEVYLVGRVKSSNKYLFRSMEKINEAVRTKKQISFKYLKHTLQTGSEQVERKHGGLYIVSPHQLIINEGNYYLLSYDSKRDALRTYRLDRMKEVKILDAPSEGREKFAEIDMHTYTQRVFSMFGGEQKCVRIRFTNDMLDTVIDRFGTKSGATYLADGKSHFIVSADVEISNPFYSWICGFRKKATIISPPEAVDGMRNFLSDIAARYESEVK